jgi:hypothetical protein
MIRFFFFFINKKKINRDSNHFYDRSNLNLKPQRNPTQDYKDEEKKEIILTEKKLNDNTLFSIYFRILLNYFQIVSLAQNFNLRWPQDLKNLFEVQFRIGNISDFIFSYDCLVASATNIFKIYYNKRHIYLSFRKYEHRANLFQSHHAGPEPLYFQSDGHTLLECLRRMEEDPSGLQDIDDFISNLQLSSTVHFDDNISTSELLRS